MRKKLIVIGITFLFVGCILGALNISWNLSIIKIDDTCLLINPSKQFIDPNHTSMCVSNPIFIIFNPGLVIIFILLILIGFIVLFVDYNNNRPLVPQIVPVHPRLKPPLNEDTWTKEEMLDDYKK